MKIKLMAGACTVAAALALPAYAQTYPVKPLRFILPFPAGGPTDILGRIIGQTLAAQLGQPVVPENRPGAGGNVGTEYAAKQAADGYSFVLASPSLSISPSLYAKLGYDPVWWGVTFVLLAEIGLVTPPFGLNLFTIHGVLPKFSVMYIARSSLPFLAVMILMVWILIFFPDLAMWLPRQLY